MLQQLLSACDNRFQSERHGKTCGGCTYTGFCPNDACECEKCLELVHFPDRVVVGAPPRQYNCTHMADYYVCKYACKYVSELIYAFERLKDLMSLQNIKVLSFGCGPCTDLLALDFLRQRGDYCFTNLEYRGVDYSKDVWANIHRDIKTKHSAGVDVKFAYSDARDLIDKIVADKWIPDLVVFQYFFSDMNKNAEASEVSAFVNAFAEYTNTKMLDNSYIVLNDINLSIKFGGGREYFDRLLTQMNNGVHVKGHFHNNSRPNTYDYGQQFEHNKLFFDISTLALFSPFGSCSSAQMIFKKGGA
jgi:hypothetical protein